MNTKIAYLIDDDPDEQDFFEEALKDLNRGIQLIYGNDSRDAVKKLKRGNFIPDFIFLDINMPQLSGIELAGLLSVDTKIVFTTAYSEYAAESYTFQTIDYLLKPITLRRFLAAMQKIEGYFTNHESVKTFPEGGSTYFFVKSGKVLRKILLEEIQYFEGEKEYVRMVTPTEQLLIYRRLKDIEDQLATPFVRVHNSFIVNTKQINKIQDNHIYIAGKQIPISEKFKDAFMAVIQQRIF